ncbi:MAG: tetratricopeptide repeat protein [Candidatus Omnitrophota bacterium]|jgi:tetratricopeptide (TPR) repeat protein|nr:MAG: tetratricopeptide repeat protein [Candidatus Omnitrophota bacterium]
MKVLVILVTLVLILMNNVFAETIILNSGKTIEGKIIERTNESVKINIGYDIEVTYYFDEINRIDGGSATELFYTSPKGKHIAEGKRYFAEGKYEEAIKEFRDLIDIEPQSFEGYQNLGVVYAVLRRYDEAKDNFETALKLSPNSSEPYIALGKLYDELQDYQKSLFYYNKATEIEPENAKLYFDIGMVYNYLSNPQKVKDSFSEAVRLDPNFALAHSGLGGVYLYFQEYDKARNSFIKAKELFLKEGNVQAAEEVENKLNSFKFE